MRCERGTDRKKSSFFLKKATGKPGSITNGCYLVGMNGNVVFGKGEVLLQRPAGMEPGQIVGKGLNVDKEKDIFSDSRSVTCKRSPVTVWGVRNPILGTRCFRSTCVTSLMWEAHLGDCIS
jgi:hypothetical protein